MSLRYWIITTGSDWTNPAAWSLTSGGAGGASIPGVSDIALFDVNGDGSCFINTPLIVSGISIDSTFSKTINFSPSSSLQVGGDGFSCHGGTFIAGNDTTSTGSVIFDTSATFSHSDGTFSLNLSVDSTLSGGTGLAFNSLIIDNTSRQKLYVDGSVVSERSLLLGNVNLVGSSDSTFESHGDTTCLSTLLSTSPYVNLFINGDSTQNFVYENGASLPSIVFDKSILHPVKIDGTGTFLVKGDLLLRNGVLDTNGIDVRVGI